jgi:UDP-GlcNAc:undecaprenyl-phosphate GlcNAc-1-phosphate transferase
MAFVIALLAAVVLTPVAGRIGVATGLVDRPGGTLKIHTRAIPVLGGLAVVVAMVLSLVATVGLEIAVTAAIGLMFLAGLVDDVRPLPPWVRLAAQVAAGAALVAGGVRVQPLGVLGGVATVVLVLACTNAVNLIDGQDGLAAGTVSLAALGLAAVGAAAGADRLGLALAGASVGFLVWNRPPARIFLGNSGAYAAGTALAALVARATVTAGWAGLVGAGVCLGVLAYELVFTVIRRIRSGASLTGGDRLHTYDLLAARMGRPRSTVTLWIAGAAAAGLAPLATTLPVAGAVAVALSVCGAGIVLGRYLWSLRDQSTGPAATSGASSLG